MPNKNRTLVKLDDEVIEITQNSNGLQAKKLTEQDMFDVSILDEGVEKLIATAIKKTITKHQKKILEKTEVAFLGRKSEPTDDSKE